jgi:2-keto-4-pentenoate hydratase/2-oxohepta-3-ene-1,7-dioic acid hydratase in catechol pathway
VKLATVTHHGRLSLAVVRDASIDIVPSGDDWPRSMMDLVADSERWLPRIRDLPASGTLTIEDVTFSPPLRPTNIIAIGLNYPDHAHEAQFDAPSEPIVFAKLSSSVIGHGDSITWDPTLTRDVDFEAELAVVIGKPARHVDMGRALEHVFGYTCLNDVSARDLQFRDGQWVRAKSLDTFCPLGPWIVTSDEIPDPAGLHIEGIVSGQTMQSAMTGEMIFGVADLISRLSRSFTLQAGDVIATGTPSGAGYFREPRRLLADGDSVTVRVAGVGELTNVVRLGRRHGLGPEP